MTEKSPAEYKNAITRSGINIYTPIEVGDANFWIPTPQLEALLNSGLRGRSLFGLPLRTRSKVVKSAVCEALGYPVPSSFAKTQPRFVGQQLDTYSQKSLNLQIWNEELSPTRRYAIIEVTADEVIGRVKVVNGQELALLDTTGTITTKYQAGLDIRSSSHELVSQFDTQAMLPHVRSGAMFHAATSPIQQPESGALLPVSEIFQRLSPLVGLSFADPGMDQERNRGAALHRLVCQALGYDRYEDRGQFPDIRHQLLEVKLQTSPTIDLGLISPNSTDHVDVTQIGVLHPRHCDTRYAMFYASTDGAKVTLTHLFVTTGADFFTRFRRFEGRVTNGKLQIPLPRNFFAL
ncbi:restriction endonuclease [Paraburkholderia hospita]|uniref:restriction endonuclease n=1 Tax=Paraburkholderia hospita TaxID=169430 RepID=UPI000B341796|nr:restriction endonuclease [Paraburkholderia hospita]OUL86846.1 restriction endonuclease [Paraburkholderia hospita]